MTPTLERDIADYLQLEASRAIVRDTLHDIEAGITVVPLVHDRAQPRPLLLFVGAAASIALVTGIVLARHDTVPNSDVSVAASPPATAIDDTAPAIATDPTAATTTVTAPPATQAHVPLPAGARIQGVTPSCTTSDSIVYECTIPEFPADGRAPDMNGYTTIIVDDTSHVSGGCRSVSTDATQLLCYVGQRAIDEGIVSADYLGDWAPLEYTPG